MKNSLETVCVLLELCSVTLASCRGPGVVITGESEGRRNYHHEDKGNLLPAIYGNDVDIFCSGLSVNRLSISVNGAAQTTERYNSTTLKITLIKPEVRRYICNCADVETNCTKRLMVVVMPAINVLSTHVRKERLNGKLYFFVLVDEDYEIECSSNSSNLTIFKNDSNDVETYAVNSTTVRSKKMREMKTVYDDYYCYQQHAYFEEAFIPVRVYVDYLPEATDFWCVECNEQVNCSWNVLSRYTKFKLLYTDETGKSVSVCEDFSSRHTRLCEWPLAGVRSQGMDVDATKDMSLVLQACVRSFCSNQTFHINRNNIRKPPPPVLSLSEYRHRLISAKISGKETDCNGKTPIYTVRYIMPGMGFGEKYASVLSETTVSNMIFGHKYTSMSFELPCSGALYNIKIYSSCPGVSSSYLNPKSREYKSASSVLFYTKPENNSGPINPMCNMEASLINTGDRALYEVEKFARRFQTYGSALRKKVVDLKQKQAKLKEMRSEL